MKYSSSTLILFATLFGLPQFAYSQNYVAHYQGVVISGYGFGYAKGDTISGKLVVNVELAGADKKPNIPNYSTYYSSGVDFITPEPNIEIYPTSFIGDSATVIDRSALRGDSFALTSHTRASPQGEYREYRVDLELGGIEDFTTGTTLLQNFSLDSTGEFAEFGGSWFGTHDGQIQHIIFVLDFITYGPETLVQDQDGHGIPDDEDN